LHWRSALLHSWTLVDIALEDRRNKAEKKRRKKFEGKEKESKRRINLVAQRIIS